MKFARAALLAVIVGVSHNPQHGRVNVVVDAFSPSVVWKRNQGLSCARADVWLCDKAEIRLQRRGRSIYPLFQAKDDNYDEFNDDDDDEEEDDDEADDVFSKGVNSVAWLPSVKGARATSDSSAEAAVATSTAIATASPELIPLFPLGGIVYTPNSEHILNIFEPRYRQMYTDILMNGTRRFAVAMSHPTDAGRFAQMAVLFELDDLKEVSEQTGDQIKYICNHKVTGRVKLHRILNPEAWESRDTYLRAEGTVIDDSGKNTTATSAEENIAEQDLLRKAFGEMVDLQFEVEEDVRFTRASVLSLAVQPGSGREGLWQTIKLWQSFADQRLMVRQNELQGDFQEKLQEYLKKEKGLNGKELPSTIGFQDLSMELQKEVVKLQKRMRVELQPLVLESTLTMQKVLECADHTARLQLVRSFIEAEIKRLQTKKSIQGMFTSVSSSGSALKKDDAPTGGSSSSESKPSSPTKDDARPGSSSVTSSITIDDDAFQ